VTRRTPGSAIEAGGARIWAARADPRQLAMIAALLALASLAWVITDIRMTGMDQGPWTDLGSIGFYVSAWVVMIAAMMFPSIVPMVRIYDLVRCRRNERGSGATGLFVLGYVVTWTAFGLAAYVGLALTRSIDLGVLSWDGGGRYLASAVLLVSAAYQLTTLKDACLRRCRDPLDFVAHNWQPGARGATVMGLKHGAWCVGCCWALMASLFALGVMSVPWMIMFGCLIAAEKLSPSTALANRSLALALLVLALGVALLPDRVPGLTSPHPGSRAMPMMTSR
jgi:predicted metal-binding membrane protein